MVTKVIRHVRVVLCLALSMAGCAKGASQEGSVEALGPRPFSAALSPVPVKPANEPAAPKPEAPNKPSNPVEQVPTEGEPTSESPLADPKCGGEKNPCPLEHWMEEKVGAAVEKEDTKQLAVLLEQIAELAEAYPLPKAWNEGAEGWAKVSLEGAKAARAGDLKLARKSCKGCHKPWRKLFEKSEFRSKPLPAKWLKRR